MSTKNIKNAKNFDELLDIKYGKIGEKNVMILRKKLNIM